MMPSAGSSVDECPVPVTAGRRAGETVGRPGRAVRAATLVYAPVAPVGRCQPGRRRHGAVSRAGRHVPVSLAGGLFARAARASRPVAAGGRAGAGRMGSRDLRRGRHGRYRGARSPPACGGDTPPHDAGGLLSVAVPTPARRYALADRSAGHRADAGYRGALRGIARCWSDRGVAGVPSGRLARILAACADAVGTAARAARQRNHVCPRRRADLTFGRI